MTVMSLKQGKGEDLWTFISRLQIARDSENWDNWKPKTQDAVDLLSRLYEVNFKGRLMGKASDNVGKFTTEYIKDQYKRTIAGDRPS